MSSQLFIYYRIPNAETSLGIRCAQRLMNTLQEHGLGHGQLFQRQEADKPYLTLMEVINPSADHSGCMSTFTAQVEQLAAGCFAELIESPSRHVELFTQVDE